MYRWYSHIYATPLDVCLCVCVYATLSTRINFKRSGTKKIHAQNFYSNRVQERALPILFSRWFLMMKFKLIAKLCETMYCTAVAVHIKMKLCIIFNDENYSLLYAKCGRLCFHLITMGHVPLLSSTFFAQCIHFPWHIRHERPKFSHLERRTEQINAKLSHLAAEFVGIRQLAILNKWYQIYNSCSSLLEFALYVSIWNKLSFSLMFFDVR